MYLTPSGEVSTIYRHKENVCGKLKITEASANVFFCGLEKALLFGA